MKAMAKSTDNGFVAGKNYVFAGFVYDEAFVDLKTENFFNFPFCILRCDYLQEKQRQVKRKNWSEFY